MKLLNKKDRGFSIIELLIIIVIICLAGGVIWFVHSDNQIKKDSNNDAGNISPAGFNPINDWLTQCLSSVGLCLKYPSSWSPSLVSSSGFNLDSPDNTSFVQVELVGKNADSPENFYVSSQSYTYYEGTTYKVFGGYTVGENDNSTFYAVVLPGWGDPTPMKVGYTSNITTPQFIVYLHAGVGIEASIKLIPLNSVPTNASPQESTAWLNSSTSQTGLEILKSVTTTN